MQLHQNFCVIFNQLLFSSSIEMFLTGMNTGCGLCVCPARVRGCHVWDLAFNTAWGLDDLGTSSQGL